MIHSVLFRRHPKPPLKGTRKRLWRIKSPIQSHFQNSRLPNLSGQTPPALAAAAACTVLASRRCCRETVGENGTATMRSTFGQLRSSAKSFIQMGIECRPNMGSSAAVWLLGSNVFGCVMYARLYGIGNGRFLIVSCGFVQNAGQCINVAHLIAMLSLDKWLFTIHNEQRYQLTVVHAGADTLDAQVIETFQFVP